MIPVPITRNHQRIYNIVKENMLVMNKETQTCEEDFNELINDNKKRKLNLINCDIIDLEKEKDDFDSNESDTDSDIGLDENEYDREYYENDDEVEDDDDDDDVENNDEDQNDETNHPGIIDIVDLINSKLNKKINNSYELVDNLTTEEDQYFNKLSEVDQQHFKNIYKNIVSCEQSNIPIKFQILSSDISDYIKNIALQKHDILSNMEDNSSGEYHKLHNWITNLCKIPFGKYVNMPVSHESNPKDIKQFLVNTKDTLNNEVYGHLDAKDQIVRIVAQWVSNPSSKGNVIGIHGNPGVGKTTLIKNGVCEALNLPFAFIPLGGANDSSYLDGHSYTYEGSCCGKIVDVLMKNKYMNPVLYFDELDKVSMSARGQDIINVLIHLTDPSQNNSFQDKYFSDIEFDLSKCLIIFTYNDNNLIDPILKDRMITIHTKDYNVYDKLEITKNHLIPHIKKDFDIHNITITNDDITYIIDKTTSEAGVRNLKRSIECIISNVNLECLLSETCNKNIVIDKSLIDKYLVNNKDEINPSIAHLYI